MFAIATALKPGGRFLIETHTVETLARIFQASDWQWLDEDRHRGRLLQERDWDLQNSRINASWTFITDGNETTHKSSIRLYTFSELSRLLRTAGFESIEGVESLTHDTFRVGSRRLTLVAKL